MTDLSGTIYFWPGFSISVINEFSSECDGTFTFEALENAVTSEGLSLKKGDVIPSEDQ